MSVPSALEPAPLLAVLALPVAQHVRIRDDRRGLAVGDSSAKDLGQGNTGGLRCGRVPPVRSSDF